MWRRQKEAESIELLYTKLLPMCVFSTHYNILCYSLYLVLVNAMTIYYKIQ